MAVVAVHCETVPSCGRTVQLHATSVLEVYKANDLSIDLHMSGYINIILNKTLYATMNFKNNMLKLFYYK